MGHDSFQWKCDCGSVTVAIAAGPSSRAVCYCSDCQAFVRHFDKESILTPSGGTDLVQAMPDQVSFVAGHEHIVCLQLKPKGIYRWYASCCGTPMCNTPGTPKLPMASFLVAGADPVANLGPVDAHVNKDAATGPAPDQGGMMTLILPFLGRALKARLSGTWRKTPFFDETGRAVTKPKRLTDEERAKAYDS